MSNFLRSSIESRLDLLPYTWVHWVLLEKSHTGEDIKINFPFSLYRKSALEYAIKVITPLDEVERGILV